MTERPSPSFLPSFLLQQQAIKRKNKYNNNFRNNSNKKRTEVDGDGSPITRQSSRWDASSQEEAEQVHSIASRCRRRRKRRRWHEEVEQHQRQTTRTAASSIITTTANRSINDIIVVELRDIFLRGCEPSFLLMVTWLIWFMSWSDRRKNPTTVWYLSRFILYTIAWICRVYSS